MRNKKNLARLLRVNQAGEYGAKRIYAGQLAVLKRRRANPETIAQIEHMAAQEDVHLETFNALVAKNQIRPTALQPLWHVAGFALGAVTAFMGERAAMACTVAVEEVIDEHYAKQSAALDDEPELQKTPELKKIIDQFRSEENEHRLTALESGAEQAVAYPLLRRIIQAGSKTAIWLSERV
jgi:3-demethoxyubiquinol 3-hydroxylase